MMNVQEKIQSLRSSAKACSSPITFLGLLAGGCYLGSAVMGTSGLGWPLFVVAVVASFVVLILGMHTTEQENLADVLEYMTHIEAKRATRDF